MRISRRSMLAATAKAGAALCMSSLLPPGARAEALGLPVGIQLYTVRKALSADPAGTLRALATIGYREVETAGTAGLSASELSKLIADAGLKCPSAHVQFGKDDFEGGFAAAKALGATYATSSALAFAAFPELRGKPQGAERQLNADNFHRLAELMNRIGSAAKKEGLSYAYHNHNIEFVHLAGGEFGYDVLLRETDPATVVFEADCGWMAAGGASPAKYFSQYPKRFRMMHVKDFAAMAHPTTELAGPDAPKGVELGRGFIDYKPIFAAAKRAGIRHAFVEQEPPFTHSELISAKIDYDFMASFA